jgi:hypothetical protein
MADGLRNLRKFSDNRSAIDETLSHHEAHEGHEAFGDRLSKTWCAVYSNGQPQEVAPTKLPAEFFALSTFNFFSFVLFVPPSW